MKKPRGERHNPRAHTEGPDEFRKLGQHSDSASIEERDRLHPDFIQAIPQEAAWPCGGDLASVAQRRFPQGDAPPFHEATARQA